MATNYLFQDRTLHCLPPMFYAFDYHFCTIPYLFWIYYTFLSCDAPTCLQGLRRDQITKVKFLFFCHQFLAWYCSCLFYSSWALNIQFKDSKNWQKDPTKRDGVNVLFLFFFFSNTHSKHFIFLVPLLWYRRSPAVQQCGSRIRCLANAGFALALLQCQTRSE